MSEITADMIIEKMKELPESDQQTVIDFIEFLVQQEERKQKTVKKEKK